MVICWCQRVTYDTAKPWRRNSAPSQPVTCDVRTWVSPGYDLRGRLAIESQEPLHLFFCPLFGVTRNNTQQQTPTHSKTCFYIHIDVVHLSSKATLRVALIWGKEIVGTQFLDLNVPSTAQCHLRTSSFRPSSEKKTTRINTELRQLKTYESTGYECHSAVCYLTSLVIQLWRT